MAMMSQTFTKEEVFAHSNFLTTFLQVLGASLFLALCSQIKVILPFTPIPLTFQTLAILLIGATLGSQKGTYAIVLYYAEILMGLPVLSGGTSDPLIFFGPKGGYVIGFCLQAYVMGLFSEKMIGSRPLSLALGGLVSSIVQMICGIFILAQFVGWTNVWTMGLFPFVPGEILKVLLVSSGYSFLNHDSASRLTHWISRKL